MRVVFLDVDGVLNRGSFDNASSGFDPDCLNELVTLIKNTGAKIVVSSTWKISERKMNELRQVLSTVGLDFIDITAPDSLMLLSRELEIQYWLDQHSDVENFVILDDWDLSETFPNNTVCTCASDRIGLDAEWRQEAEKILLK